MVLVVPAFTLDDRTAIMRAMLSKAWIKHFLLEESSTDHVACARVGHMKCGAPVGATVTDVYRANWLFIPADHLDGYSPFLLVLELAPTIRGRVNSRLWHSRETERYMKDSNGKLMRGIREESIDTLLTFDVTDGTVDVMIAIVD